MQARHASSTISSSSVSFRPSSGASISGAVPSPQRGFSPKTISYITMPSAHRSDPTLERPPRSSSGAMYETVPPATLDVPSRVSVARPKSVSTTRPSAMRSRFCGVRSRWTIPA